MNSKFFHIDRTISVAELRQFGSPASSRWTFCVFCRKYLNMVKCSMKLRVLHTNNQLCRRWEDVWNFVNDECSNSAVFCGILHVQIPCGPAYWWPANRRWNSCITPPDKKSGSNLLCSKDPCKGRLRGAALPDPRQQLEQLMNHLSDVFSDVCLPCGPI